MMTAFSRFSFKSPATAAQTSVISVDFSTSSGPVSPKKSSGVVAALDQEGGRLDPAVGERVGGDMHRGAREIAPLAGTSAVSAYFLSCGALPPEPKFGQASQLK